ncbi:unnamed protein product [Mesocestoides corti]|nr:unnamed protein product [Mesocestoides corti]
MVVKDEQSAVLHTAPPTDLLPELIGVKIGLTQTPDLVIHHDSYSKQVSSTKIFDGIKSTEFVESPLCIASVNVPSSASLVPLFDSSHFSVYSDSSSVSTQCSPCMLSRSTLTSTVVTSVPAKSPVVSSSLAPPVSLVRSNLDTLPSNVDLGSQTQSSFTTESLTMTDVRALKSIMLQTEDTDFIWDEEIPGASSLKYMSVETYPLPAKHRSIQCLLIEPPSEREAPVDEGTDLEYEEIEVKETYYKFADSHAIATQTERVPLIEWMEFSSDTGFHNERSRNEFYEVFQVVRNSTWRNCVTDELNDYFTSVGFSQLNHKIYTEVLHRGFLKEAVCQSVEELPSVAETGVQFPYETVVREPFEYSAKSDSEQSAEETYESRLILGQIAETECFASPTTQDLGVQTQPDSALISSARTAEHEVVEIKASHESSLFQQPPTDQVFTLEVGNQTDLGLTTEKYEMHKQDKNVTESEIIHEVHVLDEPMYVKTQVLFSSVTEATQTDQLPYDYLQQQIDTYKIKKSQISCLHDLDITTYFFDEDIHEEEYLRRSHETYLVTPQRPLETETVPITLRQRVVEHELCDMVSQIDAKRWNDIREVASPITGLFAPVSFAVRQGWIRLGRWNDYVDPTTGHAIPLETALAQGRIRFASSRDATSSGQLNSSLVYIERESVVQERVEALCVLNTSTREHLTIAQARREGLIREDEHHLTWILNVREGVWITAEEAVSQNILTVAKLREQEKTEVEETAIQHQQTVIRAYHVTAVRPGGEPSEWLKPDEAVQLGLFNWQTGDLAVDWPARPAYCQYREETTTSSEYVVTQWCNFLTARQAGWIRLTPEMNFNKWVPFSQPGIGNSNRRLLSTSVSLVSETEENFTYHRTHHFTTTESREYYQSSRRSDSLRDYSRQYERYAPVITRHARLGSGSHSPEFGTESSFSQPVLGEVGEFEHSDPYTLFARHQGHLEGSEEQASTVEQELYDSGMQGERETQIYTYPATNYPSDEHVSTVRHEFEEIRGFTGPERSDEEGVQRWIRERQQQVHHHGQTEISRQTRQDVSSGDHYHATASSVSQRREESYRSTATSSTTRHQQQESSSTYTTHYSQQHQSDAH